MQDADREAFEVDLCARRPGVSLRRLDDGQYDQWPIQMAWEGWQAGAAYGRQSQEKALALAGAALMDLGRTNARLSAALINIIDCDHHNHYDGPPPRYVQIARAALYPEGSDQSNMHDLHNAPGAEPAKETWFTSDGMERAAEYLCKEAWNTHYASLRDVGSIRDNGYDPVIYDSFGGMKFQGQKSDVRAMVREIAKRLAAPVSDASTFRPTHRHRKRGSLYRVLGEATAQVGVPERLLTDYDKLIVYQEEGGKLWARFPDEFEDGRFKVLADGGDQP